MKNFEKKGLQFVLCPGRNPDKTYIEVYNQIYDAWHSIWSATYAELEDKKCLHSDTFTNQDFISAIFQDGKCQAFILYRHADLTVKSSLEDSYFEHWNEFHLQKVTYTGKHVLICGNLGIMPSARGNLLGFSMKDLMMGLITSVAIHSAVDAVISTPRADKNVNGAVYRWGGTSVAKNVDWGLGVTVDLTAFIRDQVLKNRTHEMVPMVNELWENKLVVPQIDLETVNSFLNYEKNLFKKAG